MCAARHAGAGCASNGRATRPSGDLWCQGARFRRPRPRRWRNFPGVAGLTGTFETTQRGGTLRLQSRALALALPRLFADPLAFDNTQARVGWSREGEDYAVSIDQLVLLQPATSRAAQPGRPTAHEGPGSVDLTAQLSRADVAQVYSLHSAYARNWH